MPNIASRVIEISFLTLGDSFFGEAIFNTYSNNLKITFHFSISARILKPLFKASLLIFLMTCECV